MPTDDTKNLEDLVEKVLGKLEDMDLGERVACLKAAGIVDDAGTLVDGYQAAQPERLEAQAG